MHFRDEAWRLFHPAQWPPLYSCRPAFFACMLLHAVLPLLPAKQRPLEDGDWLKTDNHVICPDPAGNVIMRIERLDTQSP